MEKTPAWCYYDNDSTSNTELGKLYNWYAVNDPRGLAPVGWRISSSEDWTSIENNLKNKITPLIENHDTWNNYLKENEKEFSLKPGGSRSIDGQFHNKDYDGVYWTAAQLNQQYANCRCYGFNCSGGEFNQEMGFGFSVRCVKNKSE